MKGPPEIWLDPRVIPSIKSGPDPDATVPLVRYQSDERVADLIRQSMPGAEFFIQILISDLELLALTNYGRIFELAKDADKWEEIESPDLGEFPL